MKSVHDCIRHRHNARITDHAVCFASMKMPYRKLSLLIMDLQHGLDEITISVRLIQTV